MTRNEKAELIKKMEAERTASPIKAQTEEPKTELIQTSLTQSESVNITFSKLPKFAAAPFVVSGFADPFKMVGFASLEEAVTAYPKAAISEIAKRNSR